MEKLVKEKLTNSKYLVNRMVDFGIRTVFSVPGAQIDCILKDIISDQRIQLINACHESGAAMMADGFIRASGQPSAVLCINGPGLLNMVTAINSAQLEHIPLLIISGDAPLQFIGKRAFQSSDPLITNSKKIMSSVLKNCFDLYSSLDCKEAMDKYEDIFSNKIGKPVYFNIPIDLQLDSYNENSKKYVNKNNYNSPDFKEIQLASKHKIVFMIGEEISREVDRKQIADFCNKYSIPTVSTYASKQFQTYLTSDLQMGVYGYGGGPRAFSIVESLDTEIIVLMGVSLNERNTALWNPVFFDRNKIIRINDYEESTSNLDINEFKIESVEDILKLLNSIDKDYLLFGVNIRRNWIEHFNHIKVLPSLDPEKNLENKLSLKSVFKVLNQFVPKETNLFVDSGDLRIAAGYYWVGHFEGNFFSSSINAQMGWAIAAGVGASVKKDRLSIILTGDGSMQMHGLELAVAAKYNLKPILLVSNNGSYGIISKRLEQINFDNKELIVELPKIDWCTFAKSIGIKSIRVTSENELTEAIVNGIESKSALLIEMMTFEGEKFDYTRGVFSSFSLVERK